MQGILCFFFYIKEMKVPPGITKFFWVCNGVIFSQLQEKNSAKIGLQRFARKVGENKPRLDLKSYDKKDSVIEGKIGWWEIGNISHHIKPTAYR